MWKERIFEGMRSSMCKSTEVKNICIQECVSRREYEENCGK
jgi:hypothetical protein